MKYKIFGKTRVKTSVIGLGFWQIGSTSWKGDTGKAINIVKGALDSGINFFDTAEVYGNGKSEASLGSSLRELGVVDEAFVATKVGGFRPTAYFIEKGVRNSIKRLGFTPFLLQLHWPPPIWIPLCELIKGLEKMVEKGYTEYVGVSNFSGRLLKSAIQCTKRYELVSNQIEYNLGFRTPEINIIPLAKKEKIEIISYSPLARGALTGANKKETIAQKVEKKFDIIIKDKELINTIEKISRERGSTKSQISLAWLLNKGVLPIPGTRKEWRVKEYAEASSISLNKEEAHNLDEASKKYIWMWGKDYRNLRTIRYIPCAFQYMALKIIGV